MISVKLNLANSFIQVANKFATVRSSSNNSASRLFSSLSHKFWIYCFKGLQFSLKRSDWFSKSFKVSHCSVINVLCFALLRQLDYFIKSLFVCQALFIFLNSVLSSLSCDSLFILSKCFSFVKNFFHDFFNQLISKQYYKVMSVNCNSQALQLNVSRESALI